MDALPHLKLELLVAEGVRFLHARREQDRSLRAALPDFWEAAKKHLGPQADEFLPPRGKVVHHPPERPVVLALVASPFTYGVVAVAFELSDGWAWCPEAGSAPGPLFRVPGWINSPSGPRQSPTDFVTQQWAEAVAKAQEEDEKHRRLALQRV